MSETAIIIFTFEGKEHTANVKPIAGETEHLYHVRMDDGYENYFLMTTDRPYQWYEQNIGYTELALVVGRAIERFFF